MATDIIQKVLDDNCHKHKPAAWRDIPIRTHLEHAQQHIAKALFKDVNRITVEDEPHIAHALTRLAFAAELEAEKDEHT